MFTKTPLTPAQAAEKHGVNSAEYLEALIRQGDADGAWARGVLRGQYPDRYRDLFRQALNQDRRS